MIAPRLQAASRRLTEKLVTPLARLGIDPNALTIAGLLFSVPTAVCIAMGWLAAGGILVLVTGGFDMLDGAVARVSGRGSTFGAFFDSTLDRWGEGVIFTGLAWWCAASGARVELVLAILTLVGSMLVSYTRARAEGLGVTCSVGVFQRPERFLVLGLALLGPAWLLSAGLWFMAVATQFTALQRVLHVHGKLERRKQRPDADDLSV